MATSEKTVFWDHTRVALLSLEENLKCKICDKLPEDPHLLWCKHSFCKECIVKLPRCPQCNYPVNPQDLVRNIMLGHLLNTMKSTSEIISRDSVIDDTGVTKQNTIKRPFTITESQSDIFKCKNIRQKSLKNYSVNKLNVETTKKKEALSISDKTNNLEVKNKKIEEINQLKRNVRLKSSNSTVNDGRNTEEQRKLSKSVMLSHIDKKSSLSSGKESIHEPANELKNSDVSSVTSKMNGYKTPTPKSKSSPKILPKSSILFSAKKIHSSNKVNVKGETPLQIACRLGKLDLVQKLLEEGAEPNVKDYANWTPLCDAVGSGKLEVVRTLLEAGAGVNTPSNLNTTALVEAVVRRDVPMVQLLMSYGADMHQRTTLNNTALSIADDEMKSVMMTFCELPTQPYPRVKIPAHAVLAVKLSPEHIDLLLTLCQKFNLTLSTAFTEDISHVVVEKTEENLCYGSVAVMMGILNGCSVVGTDWVTACLDKNELVPVESFEPSGTDDYPNTDVFLRARLNKEHLLPRLFDGCHISLQHDQCWPEKHKQDVIALIQAGGAVYQPRQCDAERILPSEQTVMFHAPTTSPLALVSHIILYQPGPSEPLLKYNMAHVKSFSVSWFVQCIKMFTLEPNK